MESERCTWFSKAPNAVVGSDVPQALLEAIVDVPAESVGRALASLQAAGFLYEASLFPDVVYRFKSALTRDVAYASLLREQRRVLHARIVEAILARDASRARREMEHHCDDTAALLRGLLG